LEGLLTSKGQSLKAIYSLGDVANLFGVSKRAIQHRIKSGQLRSRNLPGRAKFLSIDLEAFLAGVES
jgi:predicted DNA-binding protein YlxM (UPF0122 family)